MPLPQVECSGTINLDSSVLFKECVKVKSF